MIDIIFIALGISFACNLVLLNQLRTWKPKRDRNGKFIKRG